MKKFFIVLMSVVFASLMFSSPVLAWPDGSREGLVLGVTGGVSNVEFDSGSSSESGLGFMAGAMIGAGLNEQFIIDFKYRYWYADIDDIAYHTWSWCGDLIFFPVKDNGLFINGGIGRALALPDIAGAEAKGGMFFYAGAGYEITKWVFLSVDYSIGSFEDDISSGTLTFSISAVGY